jgi:hypothetical protein
MNFSGVAEPGGIAGFAQDLKSAREDSCQQFVQRRNYFAGRLKKSANAQRDRTVWSKYWTLR